MQIPPSVAQPAVKYLYQGFQFVNSTIPLAHHRAPSASVPSFAYPGAPYSPYGVQYAHATNLGTCMVNLGLMYPTQMVPQCATPHIHYQFQALLAPMPNY